MTVTSLRRKTWPIMDADLEALAIGAAILGTGGGGNPYLGKLRAQELLKRGQEIRILPFEELRDDDVIVSVGGIGAPVVGIEKIEKGDECYLALKAVEAFSKTRVTALIPAEIGGSNSIEPLLAASHANLPVVDGDGMGRAFPEVQMSTFFIYGLRPYPAALADEKGNQVVLGHVQDMHALERFARTIAVDMGATAGFALPPMSGLDIRRTAVPHTVTQALGLGRAVLEARAKRQNPIERILEVTAGRLLFEGKIVDVNRQVVKGFARGVARLHGINSFSGSELTVDIQNENLIARRDGQVIAVVPDLISMIDIDTAEPTTTETIRYGFRVAVIGMPAHPLLKTPEALEVIGPKAFGYPDVNHQPL